MTYFRRMLRLGLLGNSQGGGGGESAILLETGDYLLQEDGSSRLLLENP